MPRRKQRPSTIVNITLQRPMPPSNQQMIANSQENLKLILANYIGYVNKDYGDIVPSNERISMAISLQQFIVQAVDKYFKGQKEHGGRLVDRNLTVDMRHEIIDMMWYNAAQEWKSNV